ncbi:hypothetical protein, partial [Spartinivicinus marinus]
IDSVMLYRMIWMLFIVTSLMSIGTHSIELVDVNVTIELPKDWWIKKTNVFYIHKPNSPTKRYVFTFDKSRVVEIYYQHKNPKNTLIISTMPKEGISGTPLEYQKSLVMSEGAQLIKPVYETDMGGQRFTVLALKEKWQVGTRYETSYVTFLGQWIVEVVLICYLQPNCMDVSAVIDEVEPVNSLLKLYPIRIF